MSSLPKSNSENENQSLIERGQHTYRQVLASILEPSHDGEFIAIEPDSGQYFLEKTATGALVAARSAMPDKLFDLTRVGRETAHTVGGHAARVR